MDSNFTKGVFSENSVEFAKFAFLLYASNRMPPLRFSHNHKDEMAHSV